MAIKELEQLTYVRSAAICLHYLLYKANVKEMLFIYLSQL